MSVLDHISVRWLRGAGRRRDHADLAQNVHPVDRSTVVDYPPVHHAVEAEHVPAHRATRGREAVQPAGVCLTGVGFLKTFYD